MRRGGIRIPLYAVCLQAANAWAGGALPVPCARGGCGTTTAFVATSPTNAATAVQSGNTLTVHQTSNDVTLNWATFNVGAGNKVVFQQPASTSIALNRIFDANPSSIFGALTANGQIYLINANGFLFGSTSTVNVAGMIASSLNLTDKTFTAGILSPLLNNSGTAAAALEQFTVNSQNFASDTGTGITNTGAISVQSGARLAAADGGRLLLAAPSVQNAGSLSAPDGQIVLAAGQRAYLQADSDPSLRGLLVEVDGGTPAASQLAAGTAVAQGPPATGVTNQATGLLSAPRGNITLVGLAVNQEGRISATTSVAANGSVILEAADQAVVQGTQPLSASQGGILTIGSTSDISILPEYGDSATAVAAQAQLQSSIRMDGAEVLMHGGTITAPSAALTVTAEANPSSGVTSGGSSQARIRIDAGTSINLAGSDAVLPMDANLVTVQLRSNEFADDPTQRDGALRGDTVTVDMRADGGLGTPIADVSSAIAAVGQRIAQRTESGGTATFKSTGDVLFDPGASINVSGGATTYLAGSIQTTTLIGANGKLYDIGSASPLQAYTGAINPTLTQTYDKWGVQEVVPTPGLSRYESSYQQGAAAGTIQFAAPSMALDGSLRATAVNGAYQRGPIVAPTAANVSSGKWVYGDAVPGGTLIIGDSGIQVGVPQNGSQQYDYLAPAVTIVSNPTPVVVADNAVLPPQTVQLPAAYLTGDGITNTQINSNTTFSLPAGMPLQLPAGASLQVTASRIQLDSSIAALAGTLQFQTAFTVADQNPLNPTLLGSPRLGIAVGDNVAFNVSGQWTNDSQAGGGLGTSPTLQNGGSINLQLTQPGNELTLGNRVSLVANGGAWLQSGNALDYGKGGSIDLDASPAYSALQLGQSDTLAAFGAGTAAGGSFSLSAPRIAVSQGHGSDWTEAQLVDDLASPTHTPGTAINVYAPLFSSDGFSSISLTATAAVLPNAATDDVLTLEAGTSIIAQARSLELQPDYRTARSGGTIAAFSGQVVQPPYLRSPVSVSLQVLRETDDAPLFSARYGTLDVQKGASIQTDPGASIDLVGEGSISVDGTLSAPGGKVTLQLLSPAAYDSTTAGIFDPGYLADLGITLGPAAVIDVSAGKAVMTPNSQGLLLGTLLGGGTVNIDAERGTVLTSAGSAIDFSGSSAPLDIANTGTAGGYTRETVATPGGSLTIGAVESIDLLGALTGKAGVGNSGAAAAGSLELDLTRSESIIGQPDSAATMQLNLLGSTAGLTPGLSVDSGTVGVAQIAASGIDSLTLAAGGQTPGDIDIRTGQALSLGRQIVLESQSITVANGVSASLNAPYVSIGNPAINATGSTVPQTLSAGTGTLSVSAQQMNLEGNFALQGIANATLTSQGDVQLQGVPLTNGVETGTLLTTGNLTIDAARVYADTYTDFTINSVDAATTPGGAAASSGTLTIGRTTSSPGAPLSAGSVLTLHAANVVISGTVLAPFGEIDLSADDSLTLTSGSLVSVSGAGLEVPYGQTQANATQWIYTTSGGFTPVTGVPIKQVNLTAPDISVQHSATIDLRGGGNLYGYEWVPGTGGSYDELANAPASGTPGTAGYTPATGSYAGYYAILPASRGQAGPYDPQESGTSIPSQTVYLSAGAGLAAGFYALLPARYALEPGADLIQIQPGYLSPNGGQIATLPNGVPVLAGYLSSGTTGLHTSPGATEYEGFAIYPGSYAQQLAAYTVSDASTYFSTQAAATGNGRAAEPADAGTLSFIVAQSLNNSFNLQGSVLTAPATGGRGALVNISAPNLEITSGSQAASDGFLPVAASVLQSWNAGEITLGGTSSESIGTTATPSLNVAVAANNIVVDSGVNLTADQILLVAQQSIEVSSGASLSSTSGKAGTVLGTLPSVEATTLTNANGASPQVLPQAALLAVSDLGLPVVTRSGPVTDGATIVLAANSALNSGGALAVDAPGSITLAGALNGKGASWSLSSDGVAFVASGPAPAADTDTLSILPGVTAQLQKAGAVTITSQGNIDLFTPISLGATGAAAPPTLSSLTLSATALDNQSGGNSVLGAATVTLARDNTSAAITPTSGSGSLTIVANTLNLEATTQIATGTTATPEATPLAVNGFADTLIQVAGSVQSPASVYNLSSLGGTASTSWDTGGLSVGGDLTINALQLNPGAGSQNSIGSTGTLTLGAATAAAKGSPPTTLVGGSLALSGTSIVDDAAIAAPSGVVSLTATGGGISLGRSASINVAGVLVQAVDQSAPAPGGMVYLSATGDISAAAGSRINVSGSCVGCGGARAQVAPAGSIDMVSGGTATLLGVLSGAGKGGVGGSFSLDAGTLSGGLTPLASMLTSGGFDDAIDVRAQSGDLTLNAGTAINANRITLTADAGNLDIEGVLTATSAAQRGLIDLSAGANVIVGGALHADGLNGDGAGSAGLGGEIDINATCSTCAITLKPGSVISAQGVALVDGVAQMGQLVLRAPALTGTSDVAINVGSQGIGADVSRVGQVIVEPVMVFQEPQGSTEITADLNNDVSTASAYLTNATALILGRLSTGKSPLSVQAGVELQDPNPGDTLGISGLVDLSTYSNPDYYYGPGQQAPQVIDVSVRAAGSININGTLSDGFVADLNTGLLTLSNTPSASFSLVAGADLSSANPLSVLRNSTASLTLASSNTLGDGTPDGAGPSVIRTGTGNINLAAAGNVNLQDATSVYTGGTTPANVISTVEIDDATVSPLLMSFGANGGNVTVVAGGSVVGGALGQKFPNVDNGNYSVTGWQLRQGDTDYPAQYGVNLAAFDWNIGALGGGDVSIRAGQNVTNVSAATADSLVSAANTLDGHTVLYGAGGGLAITAGGDIGSAQTFVADGVGTLTAGGGLTAVRTAPTASEPPVGSSIAMNDSQVAVWARNSVQIDALYNPTFIPQAEGNSDDISGQYLSYEPGSSVNLSSTAGPVTLAFNINTGIQTLLGSKVISAPSNAGTSVLQIIPPNLSVDALQNSIDIQGQGYLFPSSTGQLSLFAAQDIQATGSTLVMTDTPLALLPTASAPATQLSTAQGTVSGLAPFQGAIHFGDPNPAIIAAGRDIVDLELSIPKAANLVAGRDILSLDYAGQNTSANDITLISAGRDLIDAVNVPAGIQVGGPGSLDVLAGRDLNLGTENGIVTTGSLRNANLPTSQGADVALMVGYGSQGADLSSFLNTLISPSAGYRNELVSYVDEVTGSSGLTFAEAASIFEHVLSTAQQSALIDSVFFNELLLSGRAANSGSGVGFAQGYAAIDALFPNSRGATSSASPYAGNLTLTSSQIYTDAGGNISILVPGGDIDVGFAHTPVGISSSKIPSQLGIVAQGSGNVNIYSLNDVNVNSSRIFTLGGGNILIWSTLGSIDAGNGSKSSLSVPPPTITVAANGTISISFAGALSTGSGIRTIQTSADVPPGNVDLDAPVGTVNAGDAGIGASGNINIAAAHVLGVDNINFGGTATGVPSTVSNIGVTLSGASAVGSTATSSGAAAVGAENNAQKEVAPIAQNALSWLDVFVTGLGEENCKPDDIECLKRQQTASP